MEIMIEIKSKLGESFAFGYILDDEGNREDFSESDVYFDMSEAFYENYYLFDEKIDLLTEELDKECAELTDKTHHYEFAKELVKKKTEPITAEVTVIEGPGDYVFPYDLKDMFIALIANQIA